MVGGESGHPTRQGSMPLPVGGVARRRDLCCAGGGRPTSDRQRHEQRQAPSAVSPSKKAAAARLTPGGGDFWILKIAHAPSPKSLSKNDFCPLKGGSLSDGNRFWKKIFRCGRGFRCRR